MAITVHFVVTGCIHAPQCRTEAGPDVPKVPSSGVVVATRQTSTSGKPKSPRIQVVLPENLCERLTLLADSEARTVSNMARVLIQQGVERMERQRTIAPDQPAMVSSDRVRQQLERQGRANQPRLRGAPRRLRLYRPG